MNSSFLGLLLIVTFICVSQGSHFRYGTINWWQTGEDQGLEVGFYLEDGWRASFFPDAQAVGDVIDIGSDFEYGDLEYDAIYQIVTYIDFELDYLVGYSYFFHTYATPNNAGVPWLAYFHSSARISELNNAANADWNLETTVDLANLTFSPISAQLPVVDISVYPANRIVEFPVLAISPVGAPLSYRLGDTQEVCADSENCTNPDQLSINSTNGVITWNTTGIADGLWCTVVMVNSWTAKVPVDFILNVTTVTGFCQIGCNNSLTPCGLDTECFECNDTSGVIQTNGTCRIPKTPIFIPPTPDNTQIIVTQAGSILTFDITAESPDLNSTVRVIAGGFPEGAGFLGNGTGENPNTQTFYWSPWLNQTGFDVVCFSAFAEVNFPYNLTRTFSIPYCLVIHVTAPPTTSTSAAATTAGTASTDVSSTSTGGITASTSGVVVSTSGVTSSTSASGTSTSTTKSSTSATTHSASTTASSTASDSSTTDEGVSFAPSLVLLFAAFGLVLL